MYWSDKDAAMAIMGVISFMYITYRMTRGSSDENM